MTSTDYWIEIFRQGTRLGAGFLLNQHHALTASHCVRSAEPGEHVELSLATGEKIPGRVCEHALGIDVPGDVSVVGFDDIFGSDFCHPPLSTVTAPVEQAGRTLIDLLLGARDVRSAARIVLPTVLRVRDSTGPAASQ